MKKSAIVFFFIICIISTFCACEQLRDVGSKISGNRIDTNIDHKTAAFDTLPALENNTFGLNEDVIMNEDNCIIKYNVRNVKIYNSLKEAGIDPSSSDSFTYTDEHIDGAGNMWKSPVAQGELRPGFKFILADIDVTNIKQSLDESYHIGVIRLYSYENIENEYLTEPFTDESGAAYYVDPMGYDCAPNYFHFEQTETATRSSKNSEFYHYSLAENETLNIQLGFIVNSEIADKYDLYFRIGPAVNSTRYVKLFG